MRSRVWVLAGLAAAAVAGSAAAGPPGFKTAPHRNPPQIVDHRKSAKKPLRIITLVPTTYPDAGKLQNFGKALAHSKWLADFARAYNFPDSAVAAGYQVTDMPKLGTSTTSSTYQTYVHKKFGELGIGAAPKKQTIVILYLPCKAPQALDSFGCVSHHPGFTPKSSQPEFTNHDSMAAVLGSSTATMDDRTRTASHELAEAVTDTGPGGWYLRAGDKDRPWLDVSPFVEAEGSGNTEVADMSAGARWFEPSAGRTWAYQRIYANRRSKLGGDPAVPSSPQPYFNVTSPHDWVKAPAGSTKSIALTGWSVRRIAAWTTAADVVSWSGSKDGAADPCSIVGTTSWPVANGGTVTVKVKSKAGSKGKWCNVRFKSSSASPTADADGFHPWYVGVHITG